MMLNCISRNSAMKPVVLSLAAQATALIADCSGASVTDLDSYLQGSGRQNGDTVQGYELTAEDGSGSIAAFGLAPHQRGEGVVLSAVTFTDPGMIHASGIVFAGVPFGTQPTLPDGVYKPRISLANFSTSPARVTVSIATTPQNGPSATGAAGTSPEKS